MCVNEKEVYEICMSVDSIIADKLTESIIVGTSYDMLEAHYGILPISRRNFYRRKEIAQRLTQQKTNLEEEKNEKCGWYRDIIDIFIFVIDYCGVM